MINNCIEDRIDIAKEIAEVRKSGLVNMFDRFGVLMDLGYDYAAEYIEKNRMDYLELLKLSGKY